MHVTAGNARSTAVLPLPPVGAAELEAAAEGRPSDPETLRLLEGALKGWTRAIRAALTAEPGAALDAGGDGAAAAAGAGAGTQQTQQAQQQHAGHAAELSAWGERAARLAGVREQLARPKVALALRALRAAGSSYLPAFDRLAAEAEAGWAEASDNERYLRPLRAPLERLTTSDDFQVGAGVVVNEGG